MQDFVLINDTFKCQVCMCPTNSNINNASKVMDSNGYLLCERSHSFENYTVNTGRKVKLIDKEFSFKNRDVQIFGIYSCKESSAFNSSFCLRDLGKHQKDFCVFEEKRECETEDDSFLISSLSTLDPLFYIFGLLAILGNLYVIYCKSKSLMRFKGDKERTIFNILSLNLALADFLMGTAVFMFALEITFHSHILDNHSSELRFCNAIGILTFISNQVSISMLVIISGFRLYGVTHPYRRAHLGSTMGLVAVIWLVWTVVACFPVIYQSSAFFAGGVRKTGNVSYDISFDSFFNFAKELLLKKFNLSEMYQDIFSNIQSDKSPLKLVKALEKLNLVEKGEWDFIGFYNQDPFVCIASPLAEFNKNSEILTIFILVVNLISFLFVSGAYITMLQRVITGKSAKKYLKKSIQHFTINLSQRKTEDYLNRRKLENQKMFRIVMIIVLTDLIFCIPVYVISIFYHILVESSSGYSKRCHSTLYSCLTLYVLVVIPFNSLINPYLYSIQIWMTLRKNARMSTSKLSTNLGRVPVKSILTKKT